MPREPAPARQGTLISSIVSGMLTHFLQIMRNINVCLLMVKQKKGQINEKEITNFYFFYLY